MNVPHSLTENMNQLLIEMFMEDEITRSLFYMAPTNSPGPDGCHALFFHKHLSMVGVQSSPSLSKGS